MSISFCNENRVWKNLIVRMKQPINFLKICGDHELTNPVIDEKSNQLGVWKDLCMINYNITAWIDKIIHIIPSLSLLQLEKGFHELKNDQTNWKKIFYFYKNWLKYIDFYTFISVNAFNEVFWGNLQILSSATWGGFLVYSTNGTEIMKKSQKSDDHIPFDNYDDDFVKDLKFWNIDINNKLIVGITENNEGLMSWNLDSGNFVASVNIDNHYIFTINNSYLYTITDELELSEFKFINDFEGIIDEVITLNDRTITGFPINFKIEKFKIIHISADLKLVTIVRRKEELIEIIQLMIPSQDLGDESANFEVYNLRLYSFSDIDEKIPIMCHVALNKFLLMGYEGILFIHPIEEPTQESTLTVRWYYESYITCVEMFLDVILLGFVNGKVGIQKFNYTNDIVQNDYIEVQIDAHAIRNIHIDSINGKPYILVASDYKIQRLLIPGY